MKSKFRVWGALALCSLFSINAIAASGVVLSVEKGQKELEAFVQIAPAYFHGRPFEVLKDRTMLFENENTHVQLAPRKATNPMVAHRDVVLVLPEQLDYPSLMEALIKIRAAKTFGANSITAYSQIDISKIQIRGEFGHFLNLEALLAAAGAKHIYADSKRYDAQHEEFADLDPVHSAYIVGGENYVSLRDQIAGLLSKTPLNFKDLHDLGYKGLLKGQQIYWITAYTKPVNEYLFSTLAQVRWLRHQGASVHVISPYLPYARADKPEFEVGATTEGRLAADLIEAVGTEGITVVRAHAPQSLGFFTILARELSGRTQINRYLKDQGVECVISPDAGFQKDATKYVEELRHLYGEGHEVRLVVMNKERDSNGIEKLIGGTGMESVLGKKVVIIDDETASGGTLGKVAEYVHGFKPREVFAVVTHLAGPADRALNSPYITKLIVTDTVPIQQSHSKLEVLPIAEEIVKDILLLEQNRN